jgi:hypothetical protein
MMGYHATRLYINEASALSIMASPSPNTLSQVDCLHVCLDSARSWFDILFRSPVRVYTDFAFFTMGRGLKCLNTLLRLSTFDNAGWDRKAAASSSAPLDILDRLIANMEQAILLAAFDNTGAQEPDVFETCIKTFQTYRAGYVAQLNVNGMTEPNVGGAGSGGLLTPQNSIDDNAAGIWDDLANNDWWLSLLDQQYA